MAYVRKKRVGEREYYQLVEGYRDNGKVRQRVLAHLGREDAPDAALTGWQRSASLWRGRATDLLHAAQYIREGRAASLYYGERRRKRLVPRSGTPLDSERPYPQRFAPRGWWYYAGTADEAEQEAQDAIARAERYEARIARLRSVL